MKISELLGKPVISLANSSVEGILKDIIFDEKLRKARYLVLFNDNTELEGEETVFAVSDLFSSSEDVLVIKDSACVAPRSQLAVKANNPASKKAFTVYGKAYGRVTDIALDDKFNVLNLCIDDNKTLLPGDIASFSDEMLIVFDGKKVKINRSVPRPAAEEQLRRVSVQPISYTVKGDGTDSAATTHSVLADKTHEPPRIIGNYSFLLGRRVDSDISNQRGDVIVNKNTLISPAIVEPARKYGRLVELTLYSK